MSARAKIEYDLGLDLKDKHKDRVKAVFVSAPKGLPASVKDPLRMADAAHARARQSKFANSHTGQMLHSDTALPDILSDDQLARLADKINTLISKRFNVPSYSGLHADPGNPHLHSSIPLYEVIADGRGGYTLGGRIDHAKRPQEREALGLPRSPAGELRELRNEIADQIADAVADHYKDAQDREASRHLSERWRHGHLTLERQVEQAARRGDVEFVLDNLGRVATRKEGPGGAWGKGRKDARRDAIIEHNKHAGKPGILATELITRTLTNRIVHLAEQGGIDSPEQFRILAREHGLSVSWSASKTGDTVQGVSFAVQGGPKVAGGRVGASLGTLKKRLGWAEKPVYRRLPPIKGPDVEAYQEKVEAAGIKPTDVSAQAIKVVIDRLNRLEDEAWKNAAQAATLAEPAKPQSEALASEDNTKRERPKRRSNDPAYSRKTITQAASRPQPAKGQVSLAAPSTKDANMNVDKLLSELQSIPNSPPPAAVTVWVSKGTQESTAAAAATTETPATRTCHIPNPANLTPRQRDLIASEWDSREAQRTGAFDGPLTSANERLKRFQADIRKRLQSEPWPAEAERKRFMRRTAMMETDQHREWREALAAVRERADALEAQIVGMIDNAIRDRRLLAVLSDLEARDKAAVAERLDQMRSNQERQYANALTTLEHSRPGSHDRTAAQASIRRLMDVNTDIAERERQRRAEVAAKERERQDVSHSAPAQRQRQR